MKQLLYTDDSLAMTITRLTLGIVYFPHGAQKMLRVVRWTRFQCNRARIWTAVSHPTCLSCFGYLCGVFRFNRINIGLSHQNRCVRHRRGYARGHPHSYMAKWIFHELGGQAAW